MSYPVRPRSLWVMGQDIGGYHGISHVHFGGRWLGKKNPEVQQSDRSHEISVYMSRLCPRSKSSYFLRSGSALEAKVVYLREEMYLMDAAIGRPRIATQSSSSLPKPPLRPPSRARSVSSTIGPRDLPVKTYQS
ncbi:hypothetical protein PHJA_002597100 [Phtheirospermum japonicum]|uniref:Uncharacterized protein n=1 Tax=Phtheirospermum japonicum TaxID=374723 RepID=A0A830DDZ8_9LAMI|nr:hypothetical protein PHJA_002597100 [Phtheirospermum japonicum]